MKLLTKKLEKKFESYPFGSQDGKGMDAEVIAKFFNPYGSGTWLITEAEKDEEGNWLLFGYCHIFCWEWGYVTLKELQETVVKFNGIPIGGIEQDLYCEGETVKELM